MIPLPEIIATKLTLPMQLTCSRVAAWLLHSASIDVVRNGNVLEVRGTAMEVAEACSGMRSLFALTTLAIMYGYLFERKVWIRGMLALAALPIAILTNSMRIAVTGVLAYGLGTVGSSGAGHVLFGCLVFLLAIILLFGCHKAIRRCVRRDIPEEARLPA